MIFKIPALISAEERVKRYGGQTMPGVIKILLGLNACLCLARKYLKCLSPAQQVHKQKVNGPTPLADGEL